MDEDRKDCRSASTSRDSRKRLSPHEQIRSRKDTALFEIM